jgi:hypothetical protein
LSKQTVFTLPSRGCFPVWSADLIQVYVLDEIEWRARHRMNSNRPVGQNLDVTDPQPLMVRGADNPAHETFFELDWVRRHAKSSVCRAV